MPCEGASAPETDSARVLALDPCGRGPRCRAWSPLGDGRHLRPCEPRLRTGRSRGAAGVGGGSKKSSVAPGVSALQAAGGRAWGAPLGPRFRSDFALLSDLLTARGPKSSAGSPAAGGAGDFVVLGALQSTLHAPGAAGRQLEGPRGRISLAAPPERHAGGARAQPGGAPASRSRSIRLRGFDGPQRRHADPRPDRQPGQPRVVTGDPPRLFITPRGLRLLLNDPFHSSGAGPGAPDLITVRGLRLIEKCPVCLYAGLSGAGGRGGLGAQGCAP